MTTRHRLNRGGHWQANAALYRSTPSHALTSQIGLFESEPDPHHGAWRVRDHLEASALVWVSWSNHRTTPRSIHESFTPVRWKIFTVTTGPAAARPATQKQSFRTCRGGYTSS